MNGMLLSSMVFFEACLSPTRSFDEPRDGLLIGAVLAGYRISDIIFP